MNSFAQDAYVSYFEDDKDNSYLFFNSNRTGGFEPGGTDVDLDFSLNGGAPQLAPGLNTASNDFQPNVRKDKHAVISFFQIGLVRSAEMIFGPQHTQASMTIGCRPFIQTPRLTVRQSKHSPTLSWDGLTMYFDSTRPGGEGLSDNYADRAGKTER